MALQKSKIITKNIGDKTIRTSNHCFVSDDEYKINGEEIIITKDIEFCKIILNSETNEKIFIKALTKTKIISLDSLIDEEYSEINLERGSCVEMYFVFNNWYILSSDGIKSE